MSIVFYAILALAPTLVMGVFFEGLFLGESYAKRETIEKVKMLSRDDGPRLLLLF